MEIAEEVLAPDAPWKKWLTLAGSTLLLVYRQVAFIVDNDLPLRNLWRSVQDISYCLTQADVIRRPAEGRHRHISALTNSLNVVLLDCQIELQITLGDNAGCHCKCAENDKREVTLNSKTAILNHCWARGVIEVNMYTEVFFHIYIYRYMYSYTYTYKYTQVYINIHLYKYHLYNDILCL